MNKIVIELTKKEEEKIARLLEETGIRKAEDLLMYLMNKEFKNQTVSPSFHPQQADPFLPFLLEQKRAFERSGVK